MTIEQRLRKRHREIINQRYNTCQWCNQVFQPNAGDKQKYCGRDCRCEVARMRYASKAA